MSPPEMYAKAHGQMNAKSKTKRQVTSWKSSNEQGNAHYGPRLAKVAG